MWVFSTALASCHPPGAWNFDVAPKALDNVCTPVLRNYVTSLFIIRIIRNPSHFVELQQKRFFVFLDLLYSLFLFIFLFMFFLFILLLLFFLLIFLLFLFILLFLFSLFTLLFFLFLFLFLLFLLLFYIIQRCPRLRLRNVED